MEDEWAEGAAEGRPFSASPLLTQHGWVPPTLNALSPVPLSLAATPAGPVHPASELSWSQSLLLSCLTSHHGLINLGTPSCPCLFFAMAKVTFIKEKPQRVALLLHSFHWLPVALTQETHILQAHSALGCWFPSRPRLSHLCTHSLLRATELLPGKTYLIPNPHLLAL